MKSNYEERKARRIERFKDLAAKNETKSDEQFKRASDMASIIPLGQPILVGHHSEGRDRNYRKKIERLNDKGLESLDKSKYYERKAESAENNTAISSDDPEAIKKLREKLSEMELLQTFMKDANKIVRKKSLSKEDKVMQLVKLNIMTGFWAGPPAEQLYKTGFPGYALQNHSQNMARVRNRIKELEALQTLEAAEETVNRVKIVTNVDENRTQLFFPNKPDETTRKELKHHGFRWSPREGAWQRHISNMAMYYARQIAATYQGEQKTEGE